MARNISSRNLLEGARDGRFQDSNAAGARAVAGAGYNEKIADSSQMLRL